MSTDVAVPGGLPDERSTKGLPMMVVNELRTLPAERQAEFFEEYNRRRKKPWAAWLLWLVGWHFVYWGRWGLQVLYIFTLLGFYVWWAIEGFRMPGRLRHDRADVAVAVLRDLKQISR